MTVADLANQLNLKILAGEDETLRECRGCYIGDLLSWVMSKAQADDAWLTVMGNVNAVAVASLTDCACIILTENSSLDDEAKKKADSQGVCILGSEKNSYTLAIEINKLLEG